MATIGEDELDEQDVSWIRAAHDDSVLPGRGVRCWVAHRLSEEGLSADVRVLVGNRQLLADEGVPVPWYVFGGNRLIAHQTCNLGTNARRDVAEHMREQETGGATVVLLAVGPAVAAAFAIKDPLKPEAAGVIAALHAMGVKVLSGVHPPNLLALATHSPYQWQSYMVTGDNWMTARIVAEELGIHNVMAEVLPAGKADKVCAQTPSWKQYSEAPLSNHIAGQGAAAHPPGRRGNGGGWHK